MSFPLSLSFNYDIIAIRIINQSMTIFRLAFIRQTVSIENWFIIGKKKKLSCDVIIIDEGKKIFVKMTSGKEKRDVETNVYVGYRLCMYIYIYIY